MGVPASSSLSRASCPAEALLDSRSSHFPSPAPLLIGSGPASLSPAIRPSLCSATPLPLLRSFLLPGVSLPPVHILSNLLSLASPDPSRNIWPLWVSGYVLCLIYLHRNVTLLECHLLREAFSDYLHPDSSSGHIPLSSPSSPGAAMVFGVGLAQRSATVKVSPRGWKTIFLRRIFCVPGLALCTYQLIEVKA